MGIRKQILIRSYVLFLILILSSIWILWKVIKLQNFDDENLKTRYQQTYIKEKTIGTERGTIFDENGEIISYSIPKYDVYIDFGAEGLRKRNEQYIKAQLDSLSKGLADIFPKKSYHDFKRKFISSYDKKKRVLVLFKRISYKDKIKMESLPLIREKNKYKTGFIFYPIISRFYPFENMARRTIGFFEKNRNAHLTGIESSYDEYLKGAEIKIPVKRISGGYYAPNDHYDLDLSRGADVITTLDMHIQEIAQNALAKNLLKNDADYGTCIIMDVKTGKIKAWVNLGKQDSNGYFENLNYGMNKFQPGSTFKVVTLMSLLEEGYLPQDSVEYFNGKKTYYGHQIKDHEILPVQYITLEQSFVKSSNIGMIEFAKQRFDHRQDKYINYINQAYFNQKTNIDLNGEPRPYIKHPDGSNGEWYGSTLPSMSIGYELQVTPLQILRFYNSIANDGVMMKPYLVNRVMQEGKTLLKKKPFIVKSKICSKKTLKQMRKLLEKVVTDGTARHAFKNTKYKVAGKTGTAMYAPDSSGYKKDVYISSFAGYFPADVPKYSCIVVIKNKPKSVYHTGSSTAAPVFREISDKLIVDKVIQYSNKDYNLYVKKSYSPKLKNHIIANKSHKKITKKADAKVSRVPDVRGLSVRQAVLTLENIGIKKIYVQGIGRVVKQDISPAATLKESHVYLLLN